MPAMDEAEHNSSPFLKQQQWLCIMLPKYSKFPQAFVRKEDPVQLYFPKECSSNSAVAS